VRKKPVELIVKEATRLAAGYETAELPVYFETPMFAMSDEELALLKRTRSATGAVFTWRTQTRVEYLTPRRLDRLYAAGLRVVDVGLESASPASLARMNKTRSPSRYLEAASAALRAAAEVGVIVKLNVLFYVGETRETLAETFDFLDAHGGVISAVSAYPLLLYPGSDLETTIASALEEFGGSLVVDPEWAARRLTPVNPSRDYSYDRLQDIGASFGQSFQNIATYYKQRRYGYLPPRMSYDDFLGAITRAASEVFPFSLTKEQQRTARSRLRVALAADGRPE
jgi:radical SAM superfamily enzyme YgiQ (UPF0313 family)